MILLFILFIIIIFLYCPIHSNEKILCESIVYHNTVICIDYTNLYRLLIVGVLIDNKAFVCLFVT